MPQSASDEPKQETPKGLEIPVPKRRDLMDAFRKIVRPVKQSCEARHRFEHAFTGAELNIGLDSRRAQRSGRRKFEAESMRSPWVARVRPILHYPLPNTD